MSSRSTRLNKLKSAFKRSSSKSASPEPGTHSSNSYNDNDNDNENINNNDNNGLHNNEYDDDDDDPPLTPLELHGYKPNTKHKLLSTELAEEIRAHIPPILQVSHSWKLQYSLEQNGTSLNTLYNNAKPEVGESLLKRKGYLLVVMDGNHNIFGAYLNEYLRPIDRKRYYGNGDCFLWKSENDIVKNLSNDGATGDDDEHQLRLKVFPYTSLNDFIIYSDHTFISVGSGDGKFGLYISGDFESGASDQVETFGNEPLSNTSKFRILGLELWKIN